METNNDFLNAENYKGYKEVFGFREIAMRQFQKVISNMSQEYREGFWIYSNSPNMNPQKIKYIGDSRKELRNSINTLHDILQPKFDEEMVKKSEEIYKKIEKETDEDNERKGWKKYQPLYRELFQQLSYFLDRMGWLTEAGAEE